MGFLFPTGLAHHRGTDEPEYGSHIEQGIANPAQSAGCLPSPSEVPIQDRPARTPGVRGPPSCWAAGLRGRGLQMVIVMPVSRHRSGEVSTQGARELLLTDLLRAKKEEMWQRLMVHGFLGSFCFVFLNCMRHRPT